MKNISLLKLITITLLVISLAACGTKTSTSDTNVSASPDSEDNIPTLTIAEPVHKLSYLPLYVAIEKGFFDGINVSPVTLSDGSSHTNAVLTGEAWGFIGGVEHNAFAKAKGADLKAVINIVNRGDVYFVARTGLTPDTNLTEFLRGKTIVTSSYGKTPNSITRYVLENLGLDAEKDVTLTEVDNGAIPSILEKQQGDIAVVNEPTLSKGIKTGIWGEPFYNVSKELGPYAYSTVNVSLKTIEEDPETVQKFVDGMLKALAYVRDNREDAFEVAVKEFPTMDKELIKATLDRAYSDSYWDYSGNIAEEAVKTSLDVVKHAGMLEEDITYEQIIEPKFIGDK